MSRGSTFVITGKVESYPIAWSETPAGLDTLMCLMLEEDGRRLMGDLLRRSARDGWTYRVGVLETYDRTSLRDFWFDQGQHTDRGKFIFPVLLQGETSHLHGLLTVEVEFERGRLPRYVECHINT
jgi:hypothetical protein